jgi:hypothetical protein
MAKKPGRKPTQKPAQKAAQKPVVILPWSKDYGPLLARQIRACLKRYVAGDRWILMEALDLCLNAAPSSDPRFNKRYLPRPWMHNAIREIAKALRDGADPNEAFGFVRPKGKHGKHARKKGRDFWPIMFRIYELHHDEGKPLDDTTFAIVGSEFGYSYKTIDRIFNDNPKSWALVQRLAPKRDRTKPS